MLVEEMRYRLFALFDWSCFNCGHFMDLIQDHNVPQALGGRLVPGNIVILCRACNQRKADRDPESFYSPAKLDALRSLLLREVELFDFQFDQRRWGSDPVGYLLELGVYRERIEQSEQVKAAIRD
ncbi:MAG: HNH endonuclease [Burkholderiaceae bacterium]